MNPSGAATYKIPIVASAGTAGMTPSLSLDYNSQGSATGGWLGTGIVGVGWSLGGLPAIGRCPRTMAQDGVHGAVNYDANDRFCLDGQRLVATTGAYGADGTEYRTEIESFSRVISHGTAGTGPAWFEVYTKSGQILQFGNTTNSRVLAQGKTTARAWGVNKVGDTKGNYFKVTYINDTVNGQVYPSRIDYTANDAAGLTPYLSVRFVYDTNRPDVVPIYHAGSLMKTTVRLINVQTFYDPTTTLIADYRLAYQQSETTGRSRLTSVTLCDGGGSCLPSTTFTWQGGTATSTAISNVAGQNGTLIGARPYLGDFNGDGLPDIMWDVEGGGGSSAPPLSMGSRTLWTNTGAGNFAVATNMAGQNFSLNMNTPVVADFNRDGRADVWWYEGYTDPALGNPNVPLAQGPTTKWWSATGGGFEITSGPNAPNGAVLSAVTDVNGDNRPDFLWYESGSGLTVWLTNASGTVTANNVAAPVGTVAGFHRQGITYATGVDFNGDGWADLLWVTPGLPGQSTWTGLGLLAVWLGNGDGTFSQVAGADGSVAGYANYPGDFNGDGITDILWSQIDASGQSTGQRKLWIGKGDGTFEVIANPGGLNGTLAEYAPMLADLNGDGLADIVWLRMSSDGLYIGTRVAWLGKGDGTFTVISNFGNADGTLVGYAPVLADFNGDGKTDILWDSRSLSEPQDTRSSGTRVMWLSDGVAADLITNITTGTGASVAAIYKPLTDSTVYTKDETAVDPVLDAQMPMQVVSRVDASNGAGGTIAAAYAYVGAKIDQSGRGFLGFRQLRVTDLQTNIVQTTTYRQDYPYIGLAATDAQELGATNLGTTTNTYGSTALGGTRYRVFLTQSQVTKSDLDGTAFPTATSSYQYDAYNNAAQIIAATSDGYSTTTSNTYANDTTNWFLGRLTASTVTRQAP